MKEITVDQTRKIVFDYVSKLAEYLDRGTVSCPYCGANPEYLYKVED